MRFFFVLIILAVIAAGAVEWANSAWDVPGLPAASGKETVVLIPPHSRTHDIAQMLEQKGVILQSTIRINPGALQQKMLAFIFMKAADGPGCNDTAKELAKIPEVQEVHHVAGDDCYLVKVRTYDSATLMHLMRNFSKIPNLLSTRTTIVLETVKEQQQLVIPEK